MMKNYAFILLMFVLGCASVETIKSEYSAINYTDGVSRKEAALISKNFLLGHPTRKNFVVSMGDVVDRNDSWELAFPAKTIDMFSKYYGTTFWLSVDKTTGKLKKYWIEKTPGALPVEMESY